mgnify:CR=1 FL=1
MWSEDEPVRKRAKHGAVTGAYARLLRSVRVRTHRGDPDSNTSPTNNTNNTSSRNRDRGRGRNRDTVTRKKRGMGKSDGDRGRESASDSDSDVENGSASDSDVENGSASDSEEVEGESQGGAAWWGVREEWSLPERGTQGLGTGDGVSAVLANWLLPLSFEFFSPTHPPTLCNETPCPCNSALCTRLTCFLSFLLCLVSLSCLPHPVLYPFPVCALSSSHVCGKENSHLS